MIPSALLAYVLARYRFPGRRILSTILSLPLVLPPTAVGYILLQLLSIDSPVGQLLNALHIRILLTWRGAVLAAMVIAMPLVVRTARVAFEAVDPRLEAMDRTLGHTRLQTLRRVTLPLASRGLVSAAILGFTRAVGEFGATVMVAGNIPGRTQTMPLAIYEAVASGEDERAMVLALLLTVRGTGHRSVGPPRFRPAGGHRRRLHLREPVGHGARRWLIHFTSTFACPWATVPCRSPSTPPPRSPDSTVHRASESPLCCEPSPDFSPPPALFVSATKSGRTPRRPSPRSIDTSAGSPKTPCSFPT